MLRQIANLLRTSEQWTADTRHQITLLVRLGGRDATLPRHQLAEALGSRLAV